MKLKVKNLLNSLVSNRRNKIILALSLLVIALLVTFTFSVNLLVTGYNEEVKSVTFSSSGYSSNQAGSVFVQKSADWTGKDEATINFVINTKPIEKRVNRDIIIVLDTSESMTEARIADMKSSISVLADDLYTNTENSMAFITFNTNAKVETNFTRDKSVINGILDNIEVKGATNYYLALKKVEELMDSYVRKDGTDVQMIFITDGYPTEGKGLYPAQYKLLKQKYPFLITNAIQYEMGDNIIGDLESMSDYQFISFISNSDYYGFNEILKNAARVSSYYTSFVFSDTLSEYFDISSENDVKVPFGTVEIVTEGTKKKVVWNVPNHKFKTGMTYNLSIKVQLKDEYVKRKAYFPTNSNTNIYATASDISDVSLTSELTPVLKSWYDIKYNAYVPNGCNTTYTRNEVGFPFHTQTISDDVLTCNGYQFKGWKIETDSVNSLSDNTFIMPQNDVEIGSTWTSLSISKSMDGTINTRSTFYEILSDKATLDNMKSQYVTSISGIDRYNISSTTNGQGLYTYASTRTNEYPIQYYRGNISDNNVLFGGFCWKIVRTTDTGGIKLIYNGKPTNNQCLAVGSSTITGYSGIYNAATSEDLGSLAMAGYMYGQQYITESVDLGLDKWGEVVGLHHSSSTNASYFTQPIYYSNSYIPYNRTSDGVQTFRLSGTVSSGMLTSSLVGKYTMFGKTATSTSSSGRLSYITAVDETNKIVYYVGFYRKDYDAAGGQDLYTYYYNKARNTYWYYGNDVEYNNGVYTLKNTKYLQAIDYGNNISQVKNGYHYTCMSSGTTCSSVKYVFHDSEKYMRAYYITLSNGKKINDVVSEMLTNSSNTTSSDIKKAVDSWYGSNMTKYTNMLEDTVWCNNRQITYDSYYGGWIKDGDSSNYLYLDGSRFYSTNPINEESTCSYSDKFTVSSANGNGKLTYPVGLITANEAVYAGASYGTSNSSYYLYNGIDYWTMTPNRFNNTIPYINAVRSNGTVTDPDSTGKAVDSVKQQLGVRPVISLKPGVFLADGDGTATNPYVIEME